MRRSKMDVVLSFRRRRLLQALLALALLYLVLVCFLEFRFLAPLMSASVDFIGGGDALSRVHHLDSEEATEVRSAPVRPSKGTSRLPQSSFGSRLPSDLQRRRRSLIISGLNFVGTNATVGGPLHGSARDAWEVGSKLLHELKSALLLAPQQSPKENRTDDNCPDSIMLTGAQFRERGRVMVIPCGLTLGSHITLVAKPHPANRVYSSKITNLKERKKATTMESQFRMELLGLNAVDGEEPPRILHFNPRLKGDWSRKPVIEQNTCYRMQWGVAQRCEGWKSKDNEETVDGLVKCEKWIRDGDDGSAESTTTWWLNHLIGRIKKPPINWPYPFVEDKLFVLSLSAGLEGYHANVNGRHVTSFPYRTGFVLEDATGLSLNGDLDIQSIVAGSLPASHSSFALHRHLEWSTEWQALPLAEEPVELFIGILSGGSHFAERMAVRKSWMTAIRKSSNVVARFFVALNGRREVNMILKKEAEFFGDIVIVPFKDSYDLVVLKTIAICEYGVRAVSAKYIMKCDDDTFVRIEAVMNAVKKIPRGKSLYVGNINYYYQPLREGKWAVTYEEWPGEAYPPYANGAGYVVSSDIASFVVSESEKKVLRLFKMEDVSMGMWVEKFNTTRPVEYVDDYHFCRFGCIDGYYTAHYQSPRLMMCMWNKLQRGKPECCTMR